MPLPQRNLPAKLTVDFTGVEVGGGNKADHIPEGDYLFRVNNCELREKKDDPSSKYLSWMLKVEEPSNYKGKTVYHITSLKKDALWNLRSFLTDLLGADKVPQRSLDIPLAKIIAAKPLIGGTVEDDEYNGKVKSKISATFPKADWESLKGSADEVDATAEVEGQTTDGADDDDVDEIDLDDI